VILLRLPEAKRTIFRITLSLSLASGLSFQFGELPGNVGAFPQQVPDNFTVTGRRCQKQCGATVIRCHIHIRTVVQ